MKVWVSMYAYRRAAKHIDRHTNSETVATATEQRVRG